MPTSMCHASGSCCGHDTCNRHVGPAVVVGGADDDRPTRNAMLVDHESASGVNGGSGAGGSGDEAVAS
eukprot:134714-Chlamydomonas_euryale.AAC.1